MKAIATRAMSESRNAIAIQGVEGSYHHIVANKYFGQNIDLVKCDRFEDIFKVLDNGQANYAIMAIENTVAGTILPNYALLRESKYRIIGEAYLPIQHQFMALNGQTINDITEVHSHPMALLQCRNFFKQHPHLKLVESPDTAISALRLKEQPRKGVAVVASVLAAELYDLTILQSSIEDNKRNFTRFLVLEEKSGYNLENITANKASVSFHLGHRAGALAGVLAFLAGHGINLTKIQSLPLLGKEWEYFFHLDMEFKNYQDFVEAMQTIKPIIQEFQILGEYKKGEMP